MSDIVTLQTFVKDYLTSRVSLRLVKFVEENDQSLSGKVTRALAEVGICGIIGSVAGKNPDPESKLISLDLSFGVRVQENVAINRDNRVLAATVANAEERLLALAAGVVSMANCVHQVDVDENFVLIAADYSSPASWAQLLTATEALELIIRALHFQHPTTSTTICFTGFEHTPALDRQANFDVRVNLDPQEVP